MNIEKEREALVAEIELFITEAMKAYVVERWADSYQNTKPFSYTIDANNEIWWMKTQAHQLWQFWKAAKANEAKKLEGCVVVPINNTTIVAVEKMVEQQVEASGITADVFRLDGEKILNAAVEAARGGK
ncbi:conserved hypothetical protein [Acinetobacter proteolyticus]|uniref:Uncharacterized protein n=1 Tax=Acinetobacter proteolyticus TaxID=1776741 RepID=A0A653K495_9GAMM|nr:hypothetical protein [Acinetobacter proteolyticus]VXA55365.1 conserved hypothetical protein [Acinetobacter proteolyticus]